MAEDEEAEVAESKSARHGGPWLVLSWLLFTITVAAPFFLVVATALAVAAVLGADWAALRSGGPALSGEYILVAARWGIVLALRLEWLRSAYAQTSGDPFRDCIIQLYPDEASRGERRRRSQYRISVQ